MRKIRQIAMATVMGLLLAPTPVLSPSASAQQVPDFGAGPSPGGAGPMGADELADIFSKVGDQLYEDCIFELSQEQVLVQYALVQAYVAKGASGPVARKLAAQQIQPPKLSAKCEQVRGTREAAPPMQEARLEPEAQPSPEGPVSSEPEAVPTPAPEAPQQAGPSAQTAPEARESAPEATPKRGAHELTPEDLALAPAPVPAKPPRPAPEATLAPAPKVAKAPEPEPEAAPLPWSTTTEQAPKPVEKPSVVALPKVNVPQPPPELGAQPTGPVMPVAGRKGLKLWDCADGVDYVTIHINGYERKLSGGEICSPFQDVVSELPASATGFRLGYTIKTGRLFVISNDASISGKTIAWGLSGRDVCRNNPDPDCFAAKAVGPLPPGEYAFASGKEYRVSYGPRTKRHVAGIFLNKLWNKERFSPAHLAAIKARGNIAIHVRLKGEMSEACIGLEPKGWAYVASLIKDGRAIGLNAYIDEPYPQVAEAPPVVVASGFSLTSLFK